MLQCYQRYKFSSALTGGNMERVTQKQLENLATWINELTGSPLESWSRDDQGRLKSNIGNHHIHYAYGGVCLHRVMNESGGVSTPVVYGHVPKRELFNLMHAYIRGLSAQKEAA
jgi:hypothetical protein